MSELKPCPWCGSPAQLWRDGEMVECSRNPSCGWQWLRDTETKAGLAIAWNRRTPPPHTAAMVAWAKARIEDIAELRRLEMAGFNEADEAKRLEAFVGEWEGSNVP